MFRKRLACAIVILFVAVNVASAFNVNTASDSKFTNRGNTFYVGGSGPGNYSYIQEAYAAASDGDTIFVYSGTYQLGEFHICKSIYLLGENRTTTFVIGQAYLEADGIVFSGFTSMPYPGYEWASVGIICGSDNNIIRDNFISKHHFEMVLWEANNNLVEGNIFDGGSEDGIILWWDCNNNTIRNNVVRLHSEDGIRLVGTDHDNNVSNNVITNNGDGIDFWDNADQDYVYNNVIEMNSNGIHLYRANENNIWGNIIRSNGNGVYLLDDSSNNVFKENNILYNNVGMFLGTGGNTIENNTFLGNKCHATFAFDDPPYKNQWRNNYWNRPRLLPKPIRGSILPSYPGQMGYPWLDFDWHPARKPYDVSIGGNEYV